MSDEYALQITHQAVARACIAMDIKSSYSSVISVLSDVVKRYVKTVSRNALETAENAGRYAIGTQDVVVSLEQTKPRTDWRELRDFAFVDVKDPEKADEDGTKWNQPFLHEIKPFPVHRTRSDTKSNIPIEDPNLREKIRPGFPEFAPFPPIHTYKQTDNNTKKRIRGSSDNDSSSKLRHASSIKSVQKSLSRIEDAAEAEHLKRRKGTSILANEEVQRIMKKQEEIPRMLDHPSSKGGGVPDTFKVKSIDKIQNLTHEQKLLNGMKD